MGGRRTLLLVITIWLAACQSPRQEAAIPAQDAAEAAALPATTAPTMTAMPSPSVAATAITPTAQVEQKDDGLAPRRQPNADVVFVEARLLEDGTWAFAVTVEHDDTGWEDYADGWDVVLPDGTVVKLDAESPFTRLLLHPHVAEQPFTRSQSGIVIGDGIEVVTVRAHDLVDGFGGKEVTIDLTTTSGPGYEVSR